MNEQIDNTFNNTVNNAAANSNAADSGCAANASQIADGKDMKLSELVYIIDRSGSMAGLESDTIGGFNASLNAQREVEGKANVSVVLFDSEVDVVSDRVDLSQAKPLDKNTYRVGGCTALLDAVGGAVRHIQKVQSYMPDGYKAGHVIFTIITDGFENASCKYDGAQVRKMIEAAKEQGWEFIFLGANMDAVTEAARLGIDEDRAVTYLADEEGTQVAYEASAAFACAQRSMPMCAPRMDGSWAENVKKDTKKRGFFKR